MSQNINVLGNDIRKLRRHVAGCRDRISKLDDQQRMRNEERHERSEDYERLCRRVYAAGIEIREKDGVVQDLREQLLIKEGKGNFLNDMGQEDDLDLPFDDKNKDGEGVVAVAMEAFQAKMDALKRTVESSSVMSNVAMSSEVKHPSVVVIFKRTLQSARFIITPEYTYGKLAHDACVYWEVDKGSGMLKDELNMLLPPDSLVIAECGKHIPSPNFFLVLRTSKSNDLAWEDFQAAKRQGRHRGQQLKNGLEEGENHESDEEDAKNAKEQIKRFRHEKNKILSTLFHTPDVCEERQAQILTDKPESKSPDMYVRIWLRMLQYTFFMYFFIQAVLKRRRIRESNAVHSSFKNTLVTNTFPSSVNKDRAINFEMMHSIDDVWGWMEVPLLKSLFPGHHYNEQRRTQKEIDNVIGNNRLIGGVMLRQYRSGGQSESGGCASVFPALQNVEVGRDGGCFLPYSMDHQRKYVASLGASKAFGDGKAGFVFREGMAYNAFPFWSGTCYYPSDSFSIELPNDEGIARLSLARLKESVWIDESTRGIMISFNAFSTNYYSITSVKLLLEFDPSGHLKKKAEFKTFWLSFYGQTGGGDASMGTFLRLADVVMCTYCLLCIYTMAWEIALHGADKYLECLWNITDSAMCIGILAQVVFQIYYDFVISREVDVRVPHYTHLEKQVAGYDAGVNLSILNALLACVSSFRLLQRNLPVSKIWQTLGMIGSLFMSFLFLFVVMLYAFLVVAHFSFGSEVASFSTITRTMNSLMQMMSGFVQYREIRVADAVMAPIFYSAFNLAVNFFMSSILFAMVNDAYSVTNAHFSDKNSRFWKHIIISPIELIKAVYTKHRGKAMKVPAKDEE